MRNAALPAPQLVINSRMLYSSWIPADPKAATGGANGANGSAAPETAR